MNRSTIVVLTSVLMSVPVFGNVQQQALQDLACKAQSFFPAVRSVAANDPQRIIDGLSADQRRVLMVDGVKSFLDPKNTQKKPYFAEQITVLFKEPANANPELQKFCRAHKAVIAAFNSNSGPFIYCVGMGRAFNAMPQESQKVLAPITDWIRANPKKALDIVTMRLSC